MAHNHIIGELQQTHHHDRPKPLYLPEHDLPALDLLLEPLDPLDGQGGLLTRLVARQVTKTTVNTKTI